MKHYHRKLLTVALLAMFGFRAGAQQSAASVQDLVKQGVELHDNGKFTDAIAKFNEALAIDPKNEYARYELAFSLYAAKRAPEAITQLDIPSHSANTQLSAAAYCLLATIYDDQHQSVQAIANYNEAIKVNPDYPQVYYNLGVAYFRNQQFAQAELAAIQAIKHNPKHAGSQRLYALVCFHQNKRVNALLGLCSFLLLEPIGPRAREAATNIDHIMQGGVLQDAKGNNSIALNPADEKETSTLNLGISLTALAGQQKKLSGTALLEYELKNIFLLAGQLSEKKADKSFFDTLFVAYFYKLAQSDNMPAFTRRAIQAVRPDEAAAWNKANATQVDALADWLTKTERSY